MPLLRRDDRSILGREETLRSWLVKGRDPIIQEIDGLDIGWGGVQRWATARTRDGCRSRIAGSTPSAASSASRTLKSDSARRDFARRYQRPPGSCARAER